MEILATPASYSSVHDDLIYTVFDPHAGDSTTYPNYKYIGDVYINGSLIARIKKVQDPTTGIGIFNIGQIVRNYLNTSFNPTLGVLVAQKLEAGEFKIDVVMKFGEEYAYTSYYSLTQTTARTYFNNYNGRLIGATSSLSSKTNKLASDNPLIGQVLFTSSFYLVPYLGASGGEVPVVVTPTGGGEAFSTSFVTYVIGTQVGKDDLHVLNLAPGALNTIHPGAINASTTSYTVAVGGQVYTIQIICEPLHQVHMLHFLNQYGGFESKMFNKVSRKTLDISRKDFGKLPYTVDSSGVVSYKNANGVYNESRAVYSSEYKEKLTLNSDFLTDGEYAWLSDLLLSPMVYLEESGYFFPVVITENNYEPKKNINDDLTNLTINIEFGNQLNAQFR